MRAEYDTAVIRARNAANFQKFTRDADLYPNLEWLPSTSIEPRGEHVNFYGIVKPINDPFWSNNYPGDLWNCKCGITNTDKEPTEKTPSTDYTKPQGLEENPGTSGALFSNKNAYVKNAYDGANEAVEGFVPIEIIKKRRVEIKKIAKTQLLDKKVKVTSIDREVEFTVKGIKEAINQPHKYLYEKNEAILNIENLIKKSTLIKSKKHESNNNIIFYYLETKIANKPSFIVLKEDLLNKKTRFYSIVDSMK